MLTHRLIPCLDVRGDRVVKGIQFQGLRDAGDPVECAQRYADAGADEIVILDVSATIEQRNTAIQTVERVRAVLNIPLTVGGGVRQIADAQRLLDAGADKVAANTAAVEQPELLRALSDQFGRQCTILAIDAAKMDIGGWEVVTHAGKRRRGLSAIDWATKAAQLGAGEILLTSWDKDGTRSGYDLELLKAVSKAVSVPIIASGGAHHPLHMAEAIQAGASAVLAASIFHDGEYTIPQVKRALLEMGVKIRPC
ncbi:MAG: imidazole glycerol phosphate synthase subunit HisF [Myxococcota bacterium]